MNKVILMILDGFWHTENTVWNAIYAANKPFLSKYLKDAIYLNADSNYSWLPPHSMWTSEAGHVTIWAWRIVWQPYEEINQSIKSWEFFTRQLLVNACTEPLHIIWLLSDGWIHSHINHLYAILELAKAKNIKDVYIHVISDWRDVEMASVSKYLNELQTKINELKIWKISSLIWRFYAMDRDNNLDRTKMAFDLFTKWIWYKASSVEDAISYAYSSQRNDYYIPAVKFWDEVIHKDSSIIIFNFRADRSEQITKMFHAWWFTHLLAFWPYTKDYPVLFPPVWIVNNLWSVLAKHWLTQARIAETEKYPHITFYLNSQSHELNKWEKQILVPSPKVASYAEKPEMSAYEVTDKVLEQIHDASDCILINFANADLVWHSGDFEATKKAIEVLDSCVSKITNTWLLEWYDIIITSDHGNAESMIDSSWNPSAMHTLNPVPFMLISNKQYKLAPKGELKDIAPTILDLLDLPKPVEMTWISLIMK